MIQPEEQREKKNEEKWTSQKCLGFQLNQYYNEVPEWKKMEKGVEKIFKEIILKTSQIYWWK